MIAPDARKVELLDVDLIEVGARQRAVTDDAVNSLAASMKEIGLRTPVSVRYYQERPDFAPAGDTDDALVLMTGAHRLAAAKTLGWEKIECFVYEAGDEIDAELWEIDENLCRAELTAAEEAQHLARRKELWAARVERERQNQAEQVVPPEIGYKKPPPQSEGFAAETAKLTGGSKQSINRKISHAEKIDPTVLKEITGTRWDKGVNLDVLKRLTHQEQKQALFRVKSGASATFEEAFDFIRGEPPAARKPVVRPAAEPLTDDDAVERQYARIVSAWNAAGSEARQRFREYIDDPVMDGAGWAAEVARQ